MPRDWDQHYADAANLDFTPAPLLVQAAELLPPGRALDLASGPGRNALFLAQLGWQVEAVDSSEVAIRSLRDRARGLAVQARLADLERGEFAIAPDAYDLICDFYYLQRDLFPQIRAGVRPGGTLVAAIHLFEPGHTAVFALGPGELRAEFEGWKILFYSEAREHGRSRASAQIIARKA